MPSLVRALDLKVRIRDELPDSWIEHGVVGAAKKVKYHLMQSARG